MYPLLKHDRNIQITLKILGGYSDQRIASIHNITKTRARAIFYRTIADSAPDFADIKSIKELRGYQDQLVPLVVEYKGK